MDAPVFGPYAPPENVGRVLAKVRESGVRKLDTPFLAQLGIAEVMAPRTIRALDFLGLIDKNGAALPPLQEYYAAASEDDAKAILASAIKQAYELVYRAASPETATRVQVEQAFRLMQPAGQRNRMVTLFLGLCRQAGIPVKEPPTTRPGAIGRTKSKEKRVTTPPPPPPIQTNVDSLATSTVARLADVQGVLFHPAIDAYLRAIRSITESAAWNEDARNKVLQGFETQLDLFLPIKK